MHTSIVRGNVLCKNQTCPALPQSARSVTEEDDDEKIGNLRGTKICSCGETKVSISLSQSTVVLCI